MDLSGKCQLSLVDEIVTQQSAMMAWKAINSTGHPLSKLMEPMDPRTRRAKQNHRKSASNHVIAASNFCMCWNASKELRNSKNLREQSGQPTIW